MAGPADAAKTTISSLFSFSGVDGANPTAPLLLGADGNFYGTTLNGGAAVKDAAGTVFSLTPTGAHTVLAALFANGGPAHPYGGLVQTADGTFYGTAHDGTSTGFGAVFSVSPTSPLTVVAKLDGINGSHPTAGLTIGADGALYGVAFDGGTATTAQPNRAGTVFKVASGVLSTVVAFDGTNGASPYGALLLGGKGYLYGTTQAGGQNGFGNVFVISPTGQFTVLYSFTGPNAPLPTAALFETPFNVLYGTTSMGGANNVGTVFSIKLSKATTGVYKLLADLNPKTASFPVGGIVETPADKRLWGTTKKGGSSFDGTFYSVQPIGLLQTFASFNKIAANPEASMIVGPDGALYGTAFDGGGPSNAGSVYKVTIVKK